jgi:hypothetical protein
MYKNKLNNMEGKRLPKIVSKSNHNNHRLKRGWNKDAQSWPSYWGIMNTPFCRIRILLKNIIKSKFKEKMWCDKEISRKKEN